MDTRERLKRRADVAPGDIDDLIGLAAELQEADRRAAEGASVAEVQAVAAELDIEAEYVDRAVERLAKDRALAETERQADQKHDEQMAAARRMLLVTGVGGLALLLGSAAIMGLMLAMLADVRMDAARDVRDGARSSLVVVLERQAALAPQLVALAGGDAAQLEEHAKRISNAPDLEARLAASDALGSAMATALGKLPPALDPATAQSRADLQHEVAGITNRRTVEQRRYREAELAYEQARRGLGASLALGVGLH